MSAPPQPSPDVRDRAETTQKRNVRRGARVTGGPGAKERDSAIRLASRVRAGKASVLQLQTQLRRAGFDIALDGEWGPQTEAAYRTFSEGLVRAKVESDAVAPAISFEASTQERGQRTLDARDEEIHASMQDFVRSQPKKDPWYKRWSLIGMTQRSGEYISKELAAPALGSTADFFEAIPSILANPGDFEGARADYERQQLAARGAPMGMSTLGAKEIRGAAELADRFVQDVYQSTVGAPAGLAMFVAHPIDGAKAVWNDYKYRYGPLFEGDGEEFWKRQGEHPLFFVLDVASVVNVAAKGGQIAGALPKASRVRELKVGTGYVQLYQPSSALGQVLARRLDTFSEKHPDLALVGAHTRGATAIRHQADRTLDELRALTVPFQRAAKRLNAEERMAYDVMARYGPDDAAGFLELEINKRWAAANDPEVPRAVRFAQRAQHRALRRSAAQVLEPSPRLMRALALGRELTEGPGLSTETMKLELKMLDPATAAGRKDLTAQIFGQLPEVGWVKSRAELYRHYREVYPEHFATLFQEMADAAALHRSRLTGETPESYYSKFISEARATIDPDVPEDLPEGIDVLYQEGLFDVAGYEAARAERQAARPRPPAEPSNMPDAIDVRAIANAAAGFKLPDELATPAKLKRGINRVYDYARRGAAYRDWYDRAAEVAKTVAAQHNITPDQSAQLFAIYSQAADVIGNAKFVIDAIRSYQQTGTTAGIGRFPARQHAEADAVLAGKPWHGRKRNSFYANIIESVDPAAWRELNGGKPVTVDRWVVRMFAPESKKDVPGAHYDAMERLVTAMAEQLGWEPKEIQAAAWVAIKSDALRERYPAWSEARVMRAAADAYEEGYRRHGAQVGLFDLTPIDEAENIRGRVVEFAEQAVNAVKEPDGGFTVHPKTMRPDNEPQGFAVAYGAYERKVPADSITQDDLVTYIRDHQDVLDSDRAARLGGWHNPEDGQVYLDITKIVDDRAEAEAFMREQGQLSMLDREAAFGRDDWDNAFVSSGLTPEQADAIKAGHRAVAQWRGLVESAARDQLGAKAKIGARQFDMAEDIILKWADDHPESKFAGKIRDLYLRQHEHQKPPEPDELFQSWHEGSPEDPMDIRGGGPKNLGDLSSPEWAIPEDTEAWVRAGREDPMQAPGELEGLADEPDVDWLAQESPSAGDYQIVSERPGQVGVRYGERPGVMYFESREKADLFIEDQVKRRQYLLENHPDLYYQRANKFGVTVKPDAGTVRGMVDFRSGQAKVGLNPEAANVSTPLHEQAHIIRRFLPEPALKRLEEILDVEDGVWKRAHEEKFAKMVETYFWRGQAPNWQLRASFAQLRAGMREVYRTSPRPGGVSAEQGERLYRLLDEIFDPTLAIKAGDGAFYMPDVASWRGRGATSGRRKSLRQAKVKQQKNRGVLAGQGRIQRGPKVTVMEFNRTARLYENRISIKYLEQIADELDFDQHPETGGVPPGYGLFNPRGVEVPRVFRETPTSDDFFGKFPHEMGREMQQQRDELLASAFPNDLDLIPEEYRQHAKVLPIQVIEAFTGDKVAIRMARSPRLDKLVAAMDISNAVFKAALIYGKLSYIPLNLAGNMVFLTLASGPFAGPALIRAARGIGGLDPELLAQMDLLVGEGAAAALALEERNAVTRTINKLAYAQSAVADRLPRRAAWVYYAGKAGFISEGAIRKLLEGSDEVWKDGMTFKQARFQISEAAERSMVQFRGMSPFQQEVISRAVFIYGWLRGATKYGLHSSIERPIRTNITLQLGQDAWDDMQERFGQLVSYIDGVVPVGKIQEMLGVETVPVRSTQAINPVSTAGEALAAIYNTAKGDMKQAGPVISDYLAPSIKTPIEFATGYNIFFGEQYDNRWEAVYGQPLRWPAVKIGRQLISPEITDADVADQPVERQPNYIIPSEGAARREALEELFLGSARERNLNFKAAKARGREQRGEPKAYEDYREELIDSFREAGMGDPPAAVLEELKQQVALDADPRLDKGSSYNDKLQAAAEVAGFEAPEGLPEAAAERMYLDLRRSMFANLHKWENQADRIIDSQLEGE